MNMIGYFQLQNCYSRWVNERLYDVCSAMTDAERKQDNNAFFHSIHGTFNHLLLVNRLWLGRLTGENTGVKALDEELYADFEELRQEQVRTDETLAD